MTTANGNEQTAEVDYTLGPEIRRDPYHIPIIRSRLTRGLNALFPAVREEVISAFNELVPVTDGQSRHFPFQLSPMSEK